MFSTRRVRASNSTCCRQYSGLEGLPGLRAFRLRCANIYPGSLWLIQSLAQLGRFVDAAAFQAELARLAEPTKNAFMLSTSHMAVVTLHLLQGDWGTARSQIDAWIEVVEPRRSVSTFHPQFLSPVWVLAQLGETSEALNRYREAEQIVERLSMNGVVAFRSWIDLALGRGALLLGRLDEAQRLADRVADAASAELGSRAHALHLGGDIASHRDRFDAQIGEVRYRQALALAEPRRMRPLVALAISALLNSTGGLAGSRRLTSHSPPPRPCIARWICPSGWKTRERK